MNSRALFSSFWSDDFIGELTSIEKLLFLNYHYTEAVNVLFCFAHSDRKVMFETGSTSEELDAFKQKMTSAQKIYFNKDYVFLANAHRYENLSGPMVEKGRTNALKRLPEEIQVWYKKLAKVQPKEPEVELKEPHRSIKYLDNLPESEITRFAAKHNLSEDKIRSEAESCANWVRTKGKTHSIKDYRSQLDNWLKKSSEFTKPSQDKYEVPFTDLSHLGRNR